MLVIPAPWPLVILALSLIWGQGTQGVLALFLSFSLSVTRKEQLDSFPFYAICAFTTPPHTHILSSLSHTYYHTHLPWFTHAFTHTLKHTNAHITPALWCSGDMGFLTQVFHLVWPQEGVHTEVQARVLEWGAIAFSEVQFTHPYNGLSTLWAFARMEEVNIRKILSVVASTW